MAVSNHKVIIISVLNNKRCEQEGNYNVEISEKCDHPYYACTHSCTYMINDYLTFVTVFWRNI